jgi:hypothetical protein
MKGHFLALALMLLLIETVATLFLRGVLSFSVRVG